MEHKIYGLKVIGTDDIRYIGLTKRTLYRRLYHHLYEAKKGLTYHKCNWIRKHDYNIEIVLIEDNLTYEQALQREKYWIKEYDNLVNMTEGGDINPMYDPVVKAKHKKIMGELDKELMLHRGTDNWMTSDEGKEWISSESKLRWSKGVYKPQPNKNIDYSLLHNLYIIEGKTLKELMVILDTTLRNITRNLSRLNIKKYKTK